MIFLLALAAAAIPNPCGDPQPATAQDIAHVSGALPKPSDSLIITRYENDETPPGLRAYAKVHGRWLAYDTLLFDQDIVVSKTTRDGHRMAWTWHTAEGPGESFHAILYRPNHAPICTSVDFSSITNLDEATHERSWANEFLSLDDVNIDPRGRGALVASGDIDIAGRDVHVVYKFTTKDGGRTWSAPQKIAKTYRPAGIYRTAP